MVIGLIIVAALAAWVLAVAVIVGLCAAAKRGDAALAARRHFRRPLRSRMPSRRPAHPATRYQLR